MKININKKEIISYYIGDTLYYYLLSLCTYKDNSFIIYSKDLFNYSKISNHILMPISIIKNKIHKMISLDILLPTEDDNYYEVNKQLFCNHLEWNSIPPEHITHYNTIANLYIQSRISSALGHCDLHLYQRDLVKLLSEDTLRYIVFNALTVEEYLNEMKDLNLLSWNQDDETGEYFIHCRGLSL